MRIVSGTVAETRYELTDTAGPVQTQFSTAAAPTVLYITDAIGLHKIGAVGGAPARTLHLYSPPYRSCRIWPGNDKPAVTASTCVVTYFSEYGTIVDYSAGAGCSSGAAAAPGLCQ